MNSAFDGTVAVVTGASGGMGQGVCARLEDAGANVVGIDLNGRADAAHPVIQCDIANSAEVHDAAVEIVNRHGRVDYLVNAAGVVSTTRPVEAISDAEWGLLFGVNVTGAFHWIREVAPGMKEREFGKIVNISSRAGRTLANFAGAHYSASKAAILGLTRHVALELAPHNVHVNAIAPGLVSTPMLSGSVEKARLEEFRQQTPLRRIGTPTNIADLVMFLLSPESDYITGATVDINGGDVIL